jgi:hypothetical protein
LGDNLGIPYLKHLGKQVHTNPATYIKGVQQKIADPSVNIIKDFINYAKQNI